MHGKDQSVLFPTLTEAVAARQALNIDDTEPLVKLSIPGVDGSLLDYIASAPQQHSIYHQGARLLGSWHMILTLAE